MAFDDKPTSEAVSPSRIADRRKVQLVPLPVKIIFYLMFQCVLYWIFFQLPWPLTESHSFGGRMMVKDIPQTVFTVFWLQFVAIPLVPGRLKLFFLIEFAAIIAFAFIPAWTSSFIRLGWLVLPNFLHAIYWIQFCAVGLASALSEIRKLDETPNNPR